jgi:Glycosyltransferase 61
MSLGALNRLLNKSPVARTAAYSLIDAALAKADDYLHLRRRRAPLLGSAGSDRWRFLALEPGAEVSVQGPAAWEDGETDRYSRVWQRVARPYRLVPAGILELSDARFHLPSGTVAVDGTLPSETIELLDFPFRWQYLDALRTLWAPARHVDDGFLLTLQQSGNYYHFVCEVLPLAFALKQHARWGKQPAYVGEGLPRFVYDYLRLLDFEAYCRVLPAGVYDANVLCVPTFPGLSSSPSPAHLKKVRDACLQAVGPASRERRRIYVSRADAPDRRIANEADLLGVLTEFGFERITLSNLSLVEQIRLFQSADVIVAPHGAGTTNILYAPADCVVMELMGPTIHSWSFMVIASTVGQTYGYVGCAERGRDLVVEPDVVRDVLERLLRARSVRVNA